MEELRCKGTPAQIARRVLAVLAEDPDLRLLVHPRTADKPATLIDLTAKMRGRLAVDIPDDAGVVLIEIVDSYTPGKHSRSGLVQAEQLAGYTLLTASARLAQWTKHTQEAPAERSLIEDFAAMAPLWEQIEAELTARGLVIDQAQEVDNGPMGARRLADLEPSEPRREVMEGELRKYLRYFYGGKSREEAAQLVGRARSTLERYRQTWPGIEDEVRQEARARQTRTVRNVRNV